MENKALSLSTEIDIDQEEIEIIGINTICRLCANQNERLIGIFSDEGVGNDLANKINLYLPVKVSIGDELPLQCCWNCASTILAWHELVLSSVETDRKFRNSQFIPNKQIINETVYENPAPSDDNDGPKEEIKAEDDGKPFCDICFKTLSRSRDLKRHKAACHATEDLTCIECSLTFPTGSQLNRHSQEVHNIKPKRHRRRNNEIVAEFFCDVCNKGFTRKYDMEKHKKRMHQEVIKREASPEPRRRNMAVLNRCRARDSEGKIFFKCDFCERVFKQSYNLTRHRTIHTGVRAYFCHICGKSFRMSSGLNRHITAFHQGVKNFGCEVCKKMFTARATRDEHMNIHTNNRPFVCDVCGKSFKQKASLHVHKMFHSDVYRFQCNNCGRKFRRAQDLKVHSWLHTGHRPYSCSKCKAAFRLSHDLKRHIKIHDKNGTCLCNECGSVFSQERYLNMHKKIHNRSPVMVKVEETPL